jgi:plasmid stabilization system protein ParE
MRYLVEILPSAELDAEDAYLWWCARSPERAAEWFNGLLDAIYSLDQFPGRCAAAAESEDLGVELRVLLYGKGPSPYRIYFRIVEPGSVRILLIRHGRRDRLTAEELPGD